MLVVAPGAVATDKADDAPAAPKAAPASTVDARAATQAAEKWLSTVDAGKYVESWDDAAIVFKQSITAEKWAHALTTVRDPLGKLVMRKLRSADYSTALQGAPAGEYVTVTFLTQFEFVPPAVETLALAKDPNGKWGVAGYSITDAPAAK